MPLAMATSTSQRNAPLRFRRSSHLEDQPFAHLAVAALPPEKKKGTDQGIIIRLNCAFDLQALNLPDKAFYAVFTLHLIIVGQVGWV